LKYRLDKLISVKAEPVNGLRSVDMSVSARRCYFDALCVCLTGIGWAVRNRDPDAAGRPQGPLRPL